MNKLLATIVLLALSVPLITYGGGSIFDDNGPPHPATPPTTAPSTPTTAPSPSVPTSYVGYTFHKPGTNAPWTMTLRANGLVDTDFHISPDHWESTGAHILIFWQDGIVDMLEPNDDGTFTAQGYKINNGGKSWAGTIDPPAPN